MSGAEGRRSELITVLFVDTASGSQERSADRLSADFDRFRPVVARTASAGLERIEAGDIDCVVAAYDLPDMDGLAFLRAVRELDPDLPFVMFPARGSEAIASEAVSLGVSEYLPRTGVDEEHEALASYIETTVSRRRGELEIERVREQFEKLIRHSSDVVFVVDPEGTYQYLSPAVQTVLGYEPEELVGVNGFELVHPDDVEETMAEFFRAIENPDYRPEAEFRAEHQDGSWRWLEVRGQNLLDDPDVQGFVVNGRDVTERKEYERQAAEQTDQLRRIAENLPETVIWMTDPTFAEVYYVSPGYEDIWGRPVDQLYENPVAYLEGVHPDDRQRVLRAMEDLPRQTDQGESSVTERIEYRVVRPDETVRWVRGTTVALQGEDGEFARWIGLATDITARKERERELEAFETLHRTVPDGVLLLDETGTMHHVNDAWAAMFDMEPAELEGVSYRILIEEGLIDESVSEQYSDLLRELLSAESDHERGTIEIRTTLPGQSREHVYEAHVRLLPYDETFRGSAVVVRDVTRLTRQDAE